MAQETNIAEIVQNGNDLRDIRPPVEIPNPWFWIMVAAAILAIAIAVILLWRHLRKEKSNAPRIPPIPAHVRARSRLEHALSLIPQSKPFCIEVSDIIRAYLEERFSFHAPERTTEEFLHELQATDLLLPEQKESLAAFLQRCDLVKFARYEPGEPELRDLHESALRLVDETVPQADSAALQQPHPDR